MPKIVISIDEKFPDRDFQLLAYMDEYVSSGCDTTVDVTAEQFVELMLLKVASKKYQNMLKDLSR